MAGKRTGPPLFELAREHIRAGGLHSAEARADVERWLASETSATRLAQVLRSADEGVRRWIVERARMEALGVTALKSLVTHSDERAVLALFGRDDFQGPPARAAAIFLLERVREGVRRKDSYATSEAMAWWVQLERVPGAILPDDLPELIEMATERGWERTGTDERTVVATYLSHLRMTPADALPRLWTFVARRMEHVGRQSAEPIERFASHPNATDELVRTLVRYTWVVDGRVALARTPLAQRDGDVREALLYPSRGSSGGGAVAGALAGAASASDFPGRFREWSVIDPSGASAYLGAHPDRARLLSKTDLAALLSAADPDARLAAMRALPQATYASERTRSSCAR